MARIGIAGAGVLGRLLAWQLARAGHHITVVDPAPGPQAPATGTLHGGGPHAAGFTAAGMLSPVAELDNASPRLSRLGWRSLPLWDAIAQRLRVQGCAVPLLRQHGSLLLAHGSDLGAARRVLGRLEAGLNQAPELPRPQALDQVTLARLEPALAPHLHAWLLPGEGQLMPHNLMQALAAHAPGVVWRWNERVERVEPGRLQLGDGQAVQVDLAVDVRGLGGRSASPGLRGVRGEIVWLHAPGVVLTRPLRLLHPRHRVYIVPRPDDRVVVGASEIESEDRSPVSLRTAVELMAAAQSVLPELAEARIVHLESNLRPALPDNEPATEYRSGLLRIQGLFRHGWLMAPALVQDALQTAGLASQTVTEGALTA